MIDDSLWSGVNNIRDVDQTVKFEINTFLSDKNNLSGFYHNLFYYLCIKLLNSVSIEEIAKVMKIAVSTFNIYRDTLERFGLITIKQMGKNKIIVFNSVKNLRNFELPEKGYDNYLEKKRKEIIIISPEYVKQQMDLYNTQQAQLRISGLVKDEVEKVEKQKVEAKKKEEQKFPNENYEMVLSAFKKYKKVGLLGPEVVRAKHAIKQMFLAQRTPKQIIDCIYFFSEHQRDEDYKWLQSWTLETIMKKMPEFIGGQLKSHRIGDDIRKV